MIILYLITLLLAVYMLMMWYFSFGFAKRYDNKSSDGDACLHPGISVIVAARNENSKLPLLLDALNNQTAPDGYWEVIVVDDYSADNTVESANAVDKHYPFRLLRLDEMQVESGKKSAISEGVRMAKYPVILLTDADCLPENGWISFFRKHFFETGCYFAAGLVKIKSPCKWLSGIEALDFYGLIGSSAGSAGMGFPFMCNAANMAFRRDTFIDIGGMKTHEDISSGDDVMLLHHFIKGYGSAKVSWINDQRAIVTTMGAPSLRAFFSQRIRWASKSKRYHNPLAKGVATVVLLVNLSLLVSLMMSIIGLYSLTVPAYLFGLKAFADFPLIFLTTRHFRQRCLLLWFLPATILYPFYTTFTGIVSLFWKPVWKGRRIRL